MVRVEPIESDTSATTNAAGGPSVPPTSSSGFVLKAAVACAGALYSIGIENQLAEARMCAAKLFDEKLDLLAQLESWQHVAWHNFQCCHQLQTLIAASSATNCVDLIF